MMRSSRCGVVSVFIMSTNTTRIFRYESVNSASAPPGHIENGVVTRIANPNNPQPDRLGRDAEDG